MSTKITPTDSVLHPYAMRFICSATKAWCVSSPALATGVIAETLKSEAFIAALDEVGCQFEEGDLFIPEMLIAARAMQTGLHHLLQKEGPHAR